MIKTQGIQNNFPEHNGFKTRYLITFRKNFILFVVIRRMKGSIVERQNNRKVFKNLKK